MKKWGWLMLTILIGLAVGVAVIKVRMVSSQTTLVSKPKIDEARKKLRLPPTAVLVAPDLYYLGQAKDVDGKKVEGYAFIRRKDKQVKPAKPPKGGGACYGYLTRGAKWKTLEDYLVDPENARGLSADFVRSNLAFDIGKWESAATKNILGNEITGLVDGADTVIPDGKNEVYFADITDTNAIAVTIVWGYFSGSPQSRALVEWDQVYDDVTYDWSSSGEPGKMDFENIATHELGHSVGMNDIYDSACTEVTMYGYADYGETKKRTLEQPDITGVYNLYK